MQIQALDHMVLVVRSIARSVEFYTRVLGLEARRHPGGRQALHFGAQKINLQELGRSVDPNARRPMPGAADFCLLTDMPLHEVAEHLARNGVAIVSGPVERRGACGPILSVYFHDPDDNLVEIARPIAP